MKFSKKENKEQLVQRLKIRGGVDWRHKVPRCRHTATTNSRERQAALISADLSSPAVTIHNSNLLQVLDDSMRSLIDRRNAIVDAPAFAAGLAPNETSNQTSNQDLGMIDRRLDALESHIDFRSHLAHRFFRTRSIIENSDKLLKEYSRLLGESHGSSD